MVTLNILTPSAPAFSLKLRGEHTALTCSCTELIALFYADSDSAATLKQRASKKLSLKDTEDIKALYEWHMVRYQLEDGQ